MKWIAKREDGPLTITIWWGGNGVGKIILTKNVDGNYVKIASNPSHGKDLVCVYPDLDTPGMVEFRAVGNAVGETADSRTLWLEIEQMGKTLPIQNGPTPPQSVSLGPAFKRNVPDRRDFNVEFI